MRSSFRTGVAGAAVGAVLSGFVAVPALADDGSALSSLVEDYSYPGAAAILAQQNVKLISGDGHILVADCATPPVGNIGVLKVYTTDETIGADGIGRVCFKVAGPRGLLNLEVPGVYEIRGDGQATGTGHEVTADITTDDGDKVTVDVDPDGSTQVGRGADPNNEPTTLLRLTVTGDGVAPVTGDQAAVGQLDTGGRACTGTLIQPQWVLTAAACFADDPDQPNLASGPPARPAQITFPGRAAVAINHLVPRTDRDMVLARLATSIPDITPAVIASTLPAAGTTLQTIGYGRTGTAWVTDAQHTAVTAPTEVTAATVKAATTSGTVCKGDAGGPASTANGRITAVLSRAGQGGCLGVSSGGTDVVFARTDDIAGWIRVQSTVVGPDAGENWSVASGVTASQHVAGAPGATGTDPYEGSMYTSASATQVNGSIYQDISRAINPGDTFCADAHVVTEGAAAGGGGTFTLFLTGGALEYSNRSVGNLPNGNSWTPVSTCVTATSGHSAVRVQFYPAVGGPAIGIDAVDVHLSIAKNGGFNNGSNNWTVVPGSQYAPYGPGITGNNPYEGTGFAATNTAVTDGGIYQDVNLTVNAGDTFCGSAQVASQGTTGGAGGRFAIWLIGGSQENSVTTFTNVPGGNDWTPVAAACVTATTAYNRVRVQFYPNPNAGSVVIDAVDVHKSIAKNGGFNNGSNNWTVVPGSQYAPYGPGITGNNPYEGTGFAATNTAVTDGGIYQDVNLTVNAGDTFCGSAQVASQGTTGGAGGRFAIWLIGGSQENSVTTFTNVPGGNDWTPVAACVTATTAYNRVRVQFYPNPNAGSVVIDAVDVRQSFAVNGGFNIRTQR